MKQTPFKKLTRLLLEGLRDAPPIILNIAPTMPEITHEGNTYVRLKDSRAIDKDGIEMGCYLWVGWGDWRKKQLGIIP